MSLFPALRPLAPPEGIDLRCCDVREMLASVHGARLIVADPPWVYAREAGVANPDSNGIYDGLSNEQIVAVLDASYETAAEDARLACWYTWPKDAEWNAAGGAGSRWGPRVTGGVWVKHKLTESGSRRVGNPGVGYHWRGESEPVAIFSRGTAGRAAECFPNAHVSPSGDHSEKPVEWMRVWLRAWTKPGDLVVDIFAGLAPLARACFAEGRRYVGAEIDPERHATALARLNAYRSMHAPHPR